jgi:hypothetical protein
VGGIYVFAAFPLALALLYALARRKFVLRGTVTERAKEPMAYWLYIGFVTALIAYCIYSASTASP